MPIDKTLNYCFSQFLCDLATDVAAVERSVRSIAARATASSHIHMNVADIRCWSHFFGLAGHDLVHLFLARDHCCKALGLLLQSFEVIFQEERMCSVADDRVQMK